LNQPSTVHPGDKIWLRGGTYVGHFTSSLNGTSASPIVVRQYPGERATINGYDGTSSTQTTLVINGSYTWFWGFEVMNSNTNRQTSGTGNTPPPGRGHGLGMFGPGTKAINLVIHDNSEGIDCWTPAAGSEVYGNLIYYNGWEDTVTRGSGHGIYTQNDTPIRLITDNIIFDQFSFGIHAYTEGGTLNNFDFEGNTSFNNGILSATGITSDLLLGGSGTSTSCTNSAQVAQNPVFVSNYVYGAGMNVGYSKGTCNPTIRNNYSAGTTHPAIGLIRPWGTITITGNTFYPSVQGFVPSDYPTNTYFSSRPTGAHVFVRPNQYEAGRANITIYNWDLASTVNVDFSSVLPVGSQYEIRNAQNFFGAPVLTGTYAGGTLTLPMSGLSVGTPVGVAAPPATGPEFNAFVLLSRGVGRTAPAAPKSVRPKARTLDRRS
jgi:hypothetical protein